MPRGFGDGNVDKPIDNAEKELLEEMNMKTNKMELLGKIAENTGICAAFAYYYIAINAEKVKKGDKIYKKYKVDETENEPIDDEKFVTYKELKKLISNGDIFDQFTITCLSLATIKFPDLFKD